MEIVAEFTYNHFGNILRAKRMIYAAKKAGATCVKFELRNSENYFRFKRHIQQKKKRYELSDKQIRKFVSICKSQKINWFASVHDIHSLKRILIFKPCYIKIASREARSLNFLKKVKEINKSKFPMVISTGGLSFGRIKKIYSLMKNENLTMVHTSCLYPCPVPDLNINRILKMKKNFKCKIGYSGHEEGFIPSIYAAMLDVHYLERHFSIEEKNIRIAKAKNSFRDDLCTLSPSQFAEMVKQVRLIQQLNKQKINIHINSKELKRINTYGKLMWDGHDIFVN